MKAGYKAIGFGVQEEKVKLEAGFRILEFEGTDRNKTTERDDGH